MPSLPYQIITLIADAIIFLFFGYYVFKLRSKEKEIEKKETKIDTDYHQIVNNALSRERKILEDAATEANQIMTSAQHLNRDAKALVDEALQKIMSDMQKQTVETSQYFMNSYTGYLKQIATASLTDFQSVTKGLSGDLQRQIHDYQKTMLPMLEKSLEEYKQARLKQTEQAIAVIVQKASQEIFNKTISLEDQHTLMVEALEKAKREGVFD